MKLLTIRSLSLNLPRGMIAEAFNKDTASLLDPLCFVCYWRTKTLLSTEQRFDLRRWTMQTMFLVSDMAFEGLIYSCTVSLGLSVLFPFSPISAQSLLYTQQTSSTQQQVINLNTSTHLTARQHPRCHQPTSPVTHAHTQAHITPVPVPTPNPSVSTPSTHASNPNPPLSPPPNLTQ